MIINTLKSLTKHIDDVSVATGGVHTLVSVMTTYKAKAVQHIMAFPDTMTCLSSLVRLHAAAQPALCLKTLTIVRQVCCEDGRDPPWRCVSSRPLAAAVMTVLPRRSLWVSPRWSVLSLVRSSLRTRRISPRWPPCSYRTSFLWYVRVMTGGRSTISSRPRCRALLVA